MAFDLILRGGRVLDPGRGTDATLDVAFADGRVAAVGPRIEGRGAEQVDVTGPTGHALALGMPEGDAAVLQLEEGDYTFGDAAGHDVTGNRQFAPVLTVRAGPRWRPR